jgi:hypothetical protein
MSQKTMIVLAASVTAFILVIAGGVFAGLSGPAAAAESAGAVGPDVLALWNQREAAYRDLIDQANQRLLAADSSLAATPSGPAASLTAAEAGWLALQAAPGAQLTGQPELVLFQGEMAYEVPTTRGLVYIHASTGAVLYNGATQVVAAAVSQHEREDDEHEGHDD